MIYLIIAFFRYKLGKNSSCLVSFYVQTDNLEENVINYDEKRKMRERCTDQ